MAYYDEISEGYAELHKEEQLKKMDMIKKIFIPKNSDLLLDVGCGSGFSSEWGCNVVGIDNSLGLLKKNNHNKVLGKAEFLPFKGKTFDAVVSLTAIQNFSDMEKAVKEMKRVGKEAFIISFLKRSTKKEMIMELLKKHFDVKKIIEEEKDLIVFCSR